MKTCVTVLIVSVLGASAGAAGQSAATQPSSRIAATAAREIDRLVRSAQPVAQPSNQPQQPSQRKGWIARHPKLFGGLIGFGAGCAVGASRVGGSTDNFFNALDEFACPAVGGIGAAAGVLIGSLIK